MFGIVSNMTNALSGKSRGGCCLQTDLWIKELSRGSILKQWLSHRKL